MPAFFTTDPGKTHMKITAVEISINHRHDVCPPETIPGCIHVIPCPFQLFKMIFNTFVICACPGIAGLVKIKIICCCLGHGGIGSCYKIACEHPEEDQNMKMIVENIQQMFIKINKPSAKTDSLLTKTC
jgi:hypothetical protein